MRIFTASESSKALKYLILCLEMAWNNNNNSADLIPFHEVPFFNPAIVMDRLLRIGSDCIFHEWELHSSSQHSGNNYEQPSSSMFTIWRAWIESELQLETLIVALNDCALPIPSIATYSSPSSEKRQSWVSWLNNGGEFHCQSVFPPLNVNTMKWRGKSRLQKCQ